MAKAITLVTLANYLKRSCQIIALGFAAICAVAIAVTGTTDSLDAQIRHMRDGFRQRPATGAVHIIEIDAKSLAKRGAWPWKRQIYAALIKRLGAAGVTTIAFDIDFSSPSNAEDDAVFAAAIKSFSGTIILPTFRQPEATNSNEFLENLPIAGLREHAFLGSVSVRPDRDGLVRTFPFGTVTGRIARPSIPALLSNRQGNITKVFRIDPAIDQKTLPHHSFVDVVNGTADLSQLAGKSVIIGATAVEMGDRYAMPLHGVVPGVVLQALAAETLIQGTQNESFGAWPMIILALMFGGVALRYRTLHTQHFVNIISLCTLVVVPLILEWSKLGSLEIVPALVLSIVFALLISGLSIARKLQKDLLSDRDTALPNERALLRDHRTSGNLVIVAVRLKQFEEVASLLDAPQVTNLIKRVADRIRLGFGENTVYYLGSGLLLVAAPSTSIDASIDQIEGLAALFRSPVDLGSRSMIVKPAFGIAQGDGKAVREIAGYATFAATRAHEEGHHWTLHNASATDQADRAQILLADVDQAIADDDIYVVYQPKWNFTETRVSGAEALVRWRHSVLGPIGPDQFIPILENNDRLDQLTFHVLDHSLAQLRRWAETGLDMGVAVNISAPLFGDANFIALLLERISSLGSLARKLTLEITESATIASPAQTVQALKAVRGHGVRISIDDYGTGNSTLSYLKTFPADEIKIDQSFVTRMLASHSDQILVRSTIELAHELGFAVVAEGIEDGECLTKLAEYGCDTAQGWHIGKPMAADEFFETVSPQTEQPFANAA